MSQPALLQMLADEAGKHPSFRLDFGVTMRDFLRENGRVVGVRASAATGRASTGPTWWWAPTAATRRPVNTAGSPKLSIPQGYDVLWLKVPYPDGYPDRTTALVRSRANRVALVVPHGRRPAPGRILHPQRRLRGPARPRRRRMWTEELIGRLPAYLADHLRAHREAVAGATLLNVVCGRLTEWTAPGLLLIGDAAHPMSPVGGQGVNIALRDALVAANHLCPVLTAGGDPCGHRRGRRNGSGTSAGRRSWPCRRCRTTRARMLNRPRPLEHPADAPPAAVA